MSKEQLNIFITTIGHPDFRGGGNTIIHNISAEFAKRGHNVTVLYLAPRELLDDLPVTNYKMVLRPASRIPILNMIRVLGVFKKLKGLTTPEIIISTSHEGFLIRLLKKQNIFFIAASYDPILHHISFRDLFKLKWLNPLGAGKFFQLMSLFFDRLLKLKADMVQCLSLYSLNQCVRVYGLDQSRVIVVPAGVDIDKFNRSPLPKRQILFMGGTVAYKGLDVFIRAMPLIVEKYDDAIFLVAGEMKERVEMLKRLARELGVLEKISWLGLISQNEAQECYRKACCLVAPSRIESFLIVVIEAFAAGLPVIATPVGIVPEIVEDEINGFIIERENPKALAEAVLKLFKLPQRTIEAMGNNGRQKVREMFLWSDIAELFIGKIQTSIKDLPR